MVWRSGGGGVVWRRTMARHDEVPPQPWRMPFATTPFALTNLQNIAIEKFSITAQNTNGFYSYASGLIIKIRHVLTTRTTVDEEVAPWLNAVLTFKVSDQNLLTTRGHLCGHNLDIAPATYGDVDEDVAVLGQRSFLPSKVLIKSAHKPRGYLSWHAVVGKNCLEPRCNVIIHCPTLESRLGSLIQQDTITRAALKEPLEGFR
ncbi:hypothetical protein Tco_0682926 [Tanacetum coccineum]|uniref:Uncharacterized protein n=1 Tax=Tanacetum coccineum TaxID=301880 RepID=A0ABQ4XTH3_9ASTR